MNDTIKNLTNKEISTISNNISETESVNSNLNLNSSFTWIFIIFFVVIIIGTCLNIGIVATLLRTRRNGMVLFDFIV